MGARGNGVRTVVTVRGEEVKVSDTEWVLWYLGEPAGSMSNDTEIKDDPAKAARRFWDYLSDSEIIRKLNQGYKFELMTREQYRIEAHPQMLGGYRTEVDGVKGIFMPDKER